jgi:hypothetical protein
MYYLVAYLIIFGIITTINYNVYQGAVPFLSCMVAALFFPLQVVNYIVTYILGFFGVLWTLRVGFLVSPEQFKKATSDDDDSKDPK